MENYRSISNLMKALAHPARLHILQVIAADGEACVCHLEARLGLRQAYISQQLARLREAGVVEDRKVGLNVYYALRDPEIEKLLELAGEMAGAEWSEIGDEILGSSSADCPCPRCAGAGANAVG